MCGGFLFVLSEKNANFAVPTLVHKYSMTMSIIQVTSREFRDKQALIFSLADKGEKVVIRRRGKSSYILTPLYDNDLMLSPEVNERLQEGRREYQLGQTISCTTHEELDKFLESL